MTEMTYLEIANLNENSRCLAVADMTDQTMLEKFAKNDTCSLVRNIAVEKLTDQKALFEIAKSSSFYYDGQYAVTKLTDQHLLIDCALNAESDHVREIAIKKITDKNAFEEALLLSPPCVRRRHLLLYLWIRCFGTFSFRQAKRICKNRQVTPRLLQKLNGSLSEWSLSEQDCLRLEALSAEWKTKLAKTTNDISELESERDIVIDGVVKSSYEPIISALRNQEAIFKKKLEEISSCLTKMRNQKDLALSVFFEAEKASEMYQKHNDVMSRVLEHQTDIKGSLEKIASDLK